MLLIFSDLDGTLLDSNYSFADALPALRLADQRGIPIILSSSKTRVEMEAIRAEMGNVHAFIPENGGAAILPKTAAVPFGTPYQELTAALHLLAKQTKISVRGFADMTAAEVAQLTGLGLAQAVLAKQREYDEPFLIAGGQDPAQLLRGIEEAGLRWTRGGRFFHITGPNDKAMAARAIRDHYARDHAQLTTVALGDAPNDGELLHLADIAVIVKSPYAGYLSHIVPHARSTRLAGPAGWNEAVLEILHAW
ncbi:MAG: HAD-IIB family hydrolase [Bryobacteraceae bacterium]